VADIALAPDGRAVLLLLNGSVMEAGAAALAVPQELQTTGQVCYCNCSVAVVMQANHHSSLQGWAESA
jgi:hypothetical protein